MNDKPKYNPHIHHRRSIRLKGFDYSKEGLYFVTMCCQDRACLFGEIVEANGVCPNKNTPNDGRNEFHLSNDNDLPNEKHQKMVLNEYGTIAHNEWIKTTQLRPNVELGEFIVMPNHIHVIIKLNTPVENDSLIVDTGECNSTDVNTGECNSPLRGPSQTIGAIIRGYKSSVTKQLNLLNVGCVVWQRNYHERIIRDERSHQNISKYIINNPSKWAEDKFYKK